MPKFAHPTINGDAYYIAEPGGSDDGSSVLLIVPPALRDQVMIHRVDGWGGSMPLGRQRTDMLV
jgi:hypothetical protein